MISLEPVTIAHQGIIVGGTGGGQVNSFELSVENIGMRCMGLTSCLLLEWI